MMTFEKGYKIAIGIYVFMFLAGVALVGTGVYVALHFIHKLW